MSRSIAMRRRIGFDREAVASAALAFGRSAARRRLSSRAQRLLARHLKATGASITVLVMAIAAQTPSFLDARSLAMSVGNNRIGR
jgi:hypothetical protein